MTDDCIYCKYHNTIDGLDSCAFRSGLTSNRKVCESYEKSWSKILMLNMALFSFAIAIVSIPVLIILVLLGVI